MWGFRNNDGERRIETRCSVGQKFSFHMRLRGKVHAILASGKEKDTFFIAIGTGICSYKQVRRNTHTFQSQAMSTGAFSAISDCIAGRVGRMLFEASELILVAKLSTVPEPHYCMEIVGG